MRVFISYAWENDEYRELVKRLAARLREDGIDARLDVWHLEGLTIPEFMNREIRSADKILVVCSPQYRKTVHALEDSNRITGTGWEAMLVTSSIWAKPSDRNKITPVLLRGTWQEAAPDILIGLPYFDLSNMANFEANYRDLLRSLTGQNEPVLPLLGRMPEIAPEPVQLLRGPQIDSIGGNVAVTAADDVVGGDKITLLDSFRSGTFNRAEEAACSRQILVTGHLPSGEPITSFEPEKEYALRFRVAAPSKENLARGEVDVTSVPENGLAARWIVASTNVEFVAVSAGKVVKHGNTWVAEFDLEIPGHGDSATVKLDVRLTDMSGELTLTLLVAGEEYRKLTVNLGFGVGVKDDVVCTLPNHLNLGTPHEWTEPPEHIEVNVFGQIARVSTIWGPNEYGTVDWLGNSATLKNPIQRARNALDKLRVPADAHLNDLDIGDMDRRLQTSQWKPYDWSHLPYKADTTHHQALTALACGPEFRALASEGYSLFNTCFPMGSDLRGIIETLKLGSRLDFVWTSRGAVDWVSHVPWALMYLDPLKPTEPVNCERFLGLRYRIGSKSWEPKAPSRALGAPAEVNLLHFLYWGSDPNDELREQSVWQRNEFGKLARHYLVPGSNCKDPKQQVVAALATPGPAPAAVLYFYCHCSVKDGSDPVLQFAATAKTPDIIEASDIYQGPLKTGPLVFANACGTLAADPLGTSELESRFFARDIRAFLGTETKVPVVLASRFAWLFFQFFLRKADDAPMAAGEALAQARLFLWTQYRNPGGLFYCLVNRYNLYLASDEEVAQLQRK